MFSAALCTAMTYTSHDRPLAMPAICITRRLVWKNGSNAANDATMGSTVTGVS